MKTLISDATPLILLAKVGLLELVARHFSLVITEDVALEATRKQELPDAQHIRRLLNEKKILVRTVQPSEIHSFQKQWGIGRGEASVLLLAVKDGGVFVTDDFAAMRVARSLGVSVVTSLLLLVELHHQGFLGTESAQSKLDALEEYAWLSPDVLVDARKRLKGGK